MKPEPLVLPRNCGNCRFYDGDHYCSLPVVKRMLTGWIAIPQGVMCGRHEPEAADDVEGAAV